VRHLLCKLILVGAFVWTFFISLSQGRGLLAALVISYAVTIICLVAYFAYALLSFGHRFFWRKYLDKKPWKWHLGLFALLLPTLLFVRQYTSLGSHDWLVAVATFFAGLSAYVFFKFLVRLYVVEDDRDHRVDLIKSIKASLLLGLFLVWAVYSLLFTFVESGPVDLSAAQRTVLPQDLHVGVALSGGGYRAALLHAGVLNELSKHLTITHISSVSGGSIIGAFYSLGGNPEQFRDAIVQRRLDLKARLVLLQNVIRLPFPFSIPMTNDKERTEIQLFPWFGFDRLDVQANLLDTVLYRHKKFGDLALRPGGARIQIQATNLNPILAVGFSTDGTIVQELPRLKEKVAGVLTSVIPDANILPSVPDDQSIGQIVAASGAFPGAFNALRLTLKAKGAASASSGGMILSDGGLTDNLGVSLLLERHKRDPQWHLNLLIISDGGAGLRDDETSKTGELSRSLDIVYAGSGWHPTSERIAEDLPKMVLLRPSNLAQESNATSLLKTFDDTSTLADRFTSQQANELFELGEELAKKAIRENGVLLSERRRENR
jgi:NTE family protein